MISTLGLKLILAMCFLLLLFGFAFSFYLLLTQVHQLHKKFHKYLFSVVFLLVLFFAMRSLNYFYELFSSL